jgi:hypothetical protein
MRYRPLGAKAARQYATPAHFPRPRLRSTSPETPAAMAPRATGRIHCLADGTPGATRTVYELEANRLTTNTTSNKNCFRMLRRFSHSTMGPHARTDLNMIATQFSAVLRPSGTAGSPKSRSGGRAGLAEGWDEQSLLHALGWRQPITHRRFCLTVLRFELTPGFSTCAQPRSSENACRYWVFVDQHLGRLREEFLNLVSQVRILPRAQREVPGRHAASRRDSAPDQPNPQISPGVRRLVVSN